ncbi:hypothetical protein BLL36_17735 [Pseudomonas cedrina subsp. cedrina]|uniref:Uncharacterized protein n=1 Tax=Pseudomonas cedrina subsp. cedrina TaxID=76762 RepID=A0A1V2K772_PSECE|nr:hypothetical protein BLL36_17735 [Pseudomonas cedrina subsp. cedrina]
MILQANRLQLFPPDPACPRQIVSLHYCLAYVLQDRLRWPAAFRVYIPQLHFPIQETETKTRIPFRPPDMHMGWAMLVPEKH